MKSDAMYMRAVVLVLVVAAVRDATADCDKVQITGYSNFFGPRLSGVTYQDQYSDFDSGSSINRITGIEVYIEEGCVNGLKPSYGAVSPVLGQASGSVLSVALAAGENIKLVELKYNRTCVEYIKFTSDLDSTWEAGDANSSSRLRSSFGDCNCGTGPEYLGALRGYEVASTPALVQVQFLWVADVCKSPPPPPTCNASDKTGECKAET